MDQEGKSGNDPKDPSSRKKRLSRKEQKARKKQRQPPTVSTPSAIEGDAPAIQSSERTENNDALYLANYVPTPVPSFEEVAKQQDTTHGASLGKWFPKAVCLKSSISHPNHASKKEQDDGTTPKASLVLFYQYTKPQWSEARVAQLVAYLTRIAETRKTLGGRIRVAPEGVNVTLSSLDNAGASSIETLHHFTKDLVNFDSVFQKTDFKFITDLQPDRHFKNIKILPVKELVFYGISDKEAPLGQGGEHLDAKDFHNLLGKDKESTVVIDVRNHYEAAIGRFDGQEVSNGCAYVDPKMRKSTDFPTWLAEPETQEKLKDKTVLMYCTGGVRCERASAYLNQKMGSQVKRICQLQGGIERYLQAFPDGGHWRGKNFVFDKREAIDAENPNGDGGVIGKKKLKNTNKEERSLTPKTNDIAAHCCLCGVFWDRYVGKKKCDTCGVPVLMCNTCMSKHKKRKSTEEMMARCPLCVEENITVPAKDVEYTNNGVSGRLTDKESKGRGKAAASVLKWGGGHATKKKEKQRMKRKICQFGTECVRQDCFFAHPEREERKKAESK